MLHAFMTALPGALARRTRPEAEIRAEAKQKGLSQADEDMEVYRNHHFSADALTRLLTDNRDWAFAFEDHLKRIAVPTMLFVADNKAAQPGAIMREEMAYLQRIASPQVKVRLLGRSRPRHESGEARGIQQGVGVVAPGLSVSRKPVLIRAVLLHPVENDGIGFFRRLPEEAMRLAFQHFHLRTGNSLDQHLRLRDVIAADRVRFAD